MVYYTGVIIPPGLMDVVTAEKLQVQVMDILLNNCELLYYIIYVCIKLLSRINNYTYLFGTINKMLSDIYLYFKLATT